MNHTPTTDSDGELNQLMTQAIEDVFVHTLEVMLDEDIPMLADEVTRLAVAYSTAHLHTVLVEAQAKMQKHIDAPIKKKTPFTQALEQARLGWIQAKRVIDELLGETHGDSNSPSIGNTAQLNQVDDLSAGTE